MKKWFADILGYTTLSYINFESSSKFSTLVCSSLWGYARLIQVQGLLQRYQCEVLGDLSTSLPWLRAGLPDPCVFWSSGGRHSSVGLLDSSHSRASADLCKWVLASSLCNWNRESRYTLWQRSACSRLLGRSIGCESSKKLCYLLDAEEVKGWT